MAERIDVFISSTSRDLAAYREAVAKVILQAGMYPIDMATFNPTDRNALQLCYDKMQEAEIFVGIYAHRYGYAPGPDVTYTTVDGETLAGDGETSITHFEYLWAARRNLPLFLFVVDDTDSNGNLLAWPVEYVEDGPAKSRLKAFKELIGKKHVWRAFRSPDNLASQVASALLGEVLARSSKTLSTKTSTDVDSGPRISGVRLPDVATYFRDREGQVKEILSLLTDSSTRVVSVIGRGGIGKTALVSKILGELENKKFIDVDGAREIHGIIYLSTRTRGITLERIFLDCAAVLDGEQREQLLSIWTNSEIDYDEKYRHLFEMLNKGVYVLLLDNMEDVLDNQGRVNVEELRDFLETSLRYPHNLRLLITTREPIAFSRETMRFDKRILIDDGLPEQDAIEVLRDLDPHGQYGLRDASAELLRRIVNQVHRIPRALEIVAGIFAEDPLTSIEDLVNQERLASREEFVQELAQENYKRLDQDAHSILDALAVFGSPVPMSAIEFLLKPFMPDISVRNTLVRLIQIHTVTFDRTSKLVSLHPIDQDIIYGRILTAISGHTTYTRSQLHRRAADYYASIGLPENEWSDIDDLTAHISRFQHLTLAHYYDEAFDFLQTFRGFLTRNGYRRNVIEMRMTLLEKLDDSERTRLNTGSLGLSLHKQGLSREGLHYLSQAMVMAREANDPRALGIYINQIGNAYKGMRAHSKAIECYEEARKIAISLGDRGLEEATIINLGDCYRQIGDIKKSIAMCRQAVSISEELDSDTRLGVALAIFSDALVSNGIYEEALITIDRAIELVHTKDRRAYRLSTKGNVAVINGSYEVAIANYQNALEIAVLYGDRERECLYRHHLARVHVILGNFDEAMCVLDNSVLPEKRINGFRFILLKGILLIRTGKTTQAEETLKKALDLCNTFLSNSDRYVTAMYSRAVTLLGLSFVLDSDAERLDYFQQSISAYESAVENCSAIGVIDEAKLMLKLLEPVGREDQFQMVVAILDGKQQT